MQAECHGVIKTLSSKTFSDLANARDMLSEQKRTQYVDEEAFPVFLYVHKKSLGGEGEQVRGLGVIFSSPYFPLF